MAYNISNKKSTVLRPEYGSNANMILLKQENLLEGMVAYSKAGQFLVLLLHNNNSYI
jgi:hypothetical protein